MGNDTTILGDKLVAKSHAGTLIREETPQFGSAVTANPAPHATITAIAKRQTPNRARTNRRNKASQKQGARVIDFRQLVRAELDVLDGKQISQDELIDLAEAFHLYAEAKTNYVKLRDSILKRAAFGAEVQIGAYKLELGVHLELDGKKLP